MAQNMGVGMKLVLAFVTLIIAVVLVSTVATEALDKTVKDVAQETDTWTLAIKATGDHQFMENDSRSNTTVTNVPTSWKVLDCPLSNVIVANSSGDAFTVTTDYTFNTVTGELAMQNSTGTENNLYTNVTTTTYSYCADNYLNLSWGRTILNMIAGFFALAILAVSLGLFYSVAKDTGIIN